MAEAFRESGHTARIVPLKEAKPQDASTCDLLGIGTPCFSSQAPTPVKAFLSSLPALNKQQAFVFATSGGAPGRVLYDLTTALKRKGAEVIGGHLTRGEIHYPAPGLVGRFLHRPNEQDLSSARRFAAAIAEHVSMDRRGVIDESRQDFVKPQGGFYNGVARLTTDSFLRRSLPEPKLNHSRCNPCRCCADECPVGNITLQLYPILGNKCIRCYRCLTSCPRRAFSVDWRIANFELSLIYNTTFERWFGDVKHGEEIYPGN